MKPIRAILALSLLIGPHAASAATNAQVSIETNFYAGPTLSPRELGSVAKLANLCGIDHVTGVSTEAHLGGVSIFVRGDEQLTDRKGVFKSLLVHRIGLRGGERKGDTTKAVDEFWAPSPGQPILKERTIVRLGNRTLWVQVFNGIKPEGADKVIDAFVNGRIQYESGSLTNLYSNADFTQPTMLGISGTKCWIRFAQHPLQHWEFDFRDNKVIVSNVVEMYE
jgi:hypothetical protein